MSYREKETLASHLYTLKTLVLFNGVDKRGCDTHRRVRNVETFNDVLHSDINTSIKVKLICKHRRNNDFKYDF